MGQWRAQSIVCTWPVNVLSKCRVALGMRTLCARLSCKCASLGSRTQKTRTLHHETHTHTHILTHSPKDKKHAELPARRQLLSERHSEERHEQRSKGDSTAVCVFMFWVCHACMSFWFRRQLDRRNVSSLPHDYRALHVCPQPTPAQARQGRIGIQPPARKRRRKEERGGVYPRECERDWREAVVAS